MGSGSNGTYLSPSFPRTTAWKQDDSMEGGGRERLEHVLEIERIRTNIGHIRVKTSGTSFPDRVEAGIQCMHCQVLLLHYRHPRTPPGINSGGDPVNIVDLV